MLEFFVVKNKNVIAILIDKNLQSNFSFCVKKNPALLGGILEKQTRYLPIF